MRPAYVLLLVATAAHAEPNPTPPPKVALGTSAVISEAVGVQLTASVHVQGPMYVDTQIGIGLRVPDGRDVDIWSAQIGTSAVRWTEHSAIGARASLGYQRWEVEYFEALFDDEPRVDNESMVYGEGAVFARARLGRSVALEALVGLRLGKYTVAEDGVGTMGYLSLGLVVTI